MQNGEKNGNTKDTIMNTDNQNATQALFGQLVDAFAFRTDAEMIRYLEGVEDDKVKEILQAPEHEIRDLVLQYLREVFWNS